VEAELGRDDCAAAAEAARLLDELERQVELREHLDGAMERGEGPSLLAIDPPARQRRQREGHRPPRALRQLARARLALAGALAGEADAARALFERRTRPYRLASGAYRLDNRFRHVVART